MWRHNLGTAYLVLIIGWEYVYQYRRELGDDGNRERATTSSRVHLQARWAKAVRGLPS